MVEKAFVDTNIFLYAMEAHPKFGKTAKKILIRIDRKEPAIISLINIGEICWWLEKHRRESEIEEKIKLICSILNLEIISLILEDFLLASKFVVKYKLDFNDCLYLAVMKRFGIKKIYSNDTHFDKVEWVKRSFE
ncbi:MAG: type II toxin-antitoxin system VapC family toxin [Candidatus Aenigmarchaeota archaeon]|nr:type II toxin-antitoxin system VapC family toxin [Candidatus Aenigmarchaeota archaeon]